MSNVIAMDAARIPGFTTVTKPSHRPAICVFGKPNAGTTRFGMTMPHDNGCIAFLALDINSKATIHEYKEKNPDWPVIVNEEPYISDEEAINAVRRMEVGAGMKNQDAAKKAKEEASEQAKQDYVRVVDKIRSDVIKLVSSRSVESICIDKASQLYNYILFSRHGRAQQIEQLSRMVPNQDMIDLVNYIRGRKNLLLIHRSADIYEKTGEVDPISKREKTVASGRYKPEAMGNIEGFVTATIELTSEDRLGVRGKKNYDETEEQAKKRIFRLKYNVRVHKCKGNTLLEGQTLEKLPTEIEERLIESDEYEGPGVCGLDINWDNVVRVLGIS